MRYERKYKIEQGDRFLVEPILRLHPAGFRRSFSSRQINNIYFDTVNLSGLQDNLSGVSRRDKYRLRWYGPVHQITAPQLEAKRKVNHQGNKERWSLPDFYWSDRRLILQEVNTRLGQQGQLQPVMINTYQRDYWVAAGGHFRLTIDTGLQFAAIPPAGREPVFRYREPGVILELKYESERDDAADQLTQYFPFRLTKSSKFALGLACLLQTGG